MTPRILCQISLPAPASLGAGKYQQWLDATRNEAVWVRQENDFGPSIGMEVTLSERTQLATPITFLAWVERLMHEAGVLTQAQRLESVGIHTDRNQEIAAGRVRVQLWSAD